MNSKLVLAIAALILLAGGIFAVRSLTSTSTVIETSDARDAGDTGIDSSESGTDSDSGETKIGTTERETASSRRSPRTFSRGEGAAAIDVTPATTTPEQMAAIPVVTPETTSTEDALAEQREIADLVAMFRSKTDPEERVDIADELGMIDNPGAVKSAIELLRTEQDPTVQAALLEAMQGLEALEQTSPEVIASVRDIYSKSEDIDVRIAAQDLLGDVANAESTNLLREMRNTEDPVSRLNVTENLMRTWASDPELVPQEEVEMYNGQLQQEYQVGTDAAFRSQAIMGLAVNGRENVDFFKDALNMEQDQELRQLLERLVRMYSTPQPGPAGVVTTPAPTPVPAQ